MEDSVVKAKLKINEKYYYFDMEDKIPKDDFIAVGISCQPNEAAFKAQEADSIPGRTFN